MEALHSVLSQFQTATAASTALKASPAYLPQSRALLLDDPEPQPMPGSANVPQGDQLNEKTYTETMPCPNERGLFVYYF